MMIEKKKKVEPSTQRKHLKIGQTKMDCIRKLHGVDNRAAFVLQVCVFNIYGKRAARICSR